MNKVEFDITEAQRLFLAETSRAASYIGGLGSGKSFVLILWAFLQAMKGRTVLYILPSYPMVRDIAFPLIMEIAEKLNMLDHTNLNRSNATLTIGRGTIMFRSAETGDRIRGINAHDLAFDEAAFISKNFYLMAIGRVRKSEDSMIRAVGTPCGKTWFTEFDILFTQSTFANPFIPTAYKDQLAREYVGEFARQELYGEIINSDGVQQLLSTRDINLAANRVPVVSSGEPIVGGLDVARFGDDKSVLILRQGNKLLKIKTWSRIRTTELARAVSDICIDMGVAVLVVDSIGVGGGPTDQLVESIGSEVKVVEYNSGYKPQNPKYYNLRAESYHELQRWIGTSGSIKGAPQEFLDELLQIRYNIIGKNKIIIESKDQMKKRMHSPDKSDALSMTFWEVANKSALQSKTKKKKKAIRRRSAWAR